MSAVTKDAMSILSKKVATMSRELQQLRPYRKLVDIDAEIAAKREAFAQLHDEKMAKLKSAVDAARTSIQQEFAKARQAREEALREKEKAIALGRALIARAQEHAERIGREAGEKIFHEYEKIGDERYAATKESERILALARTRANEMLAAASARLEAVTATEQAGAKAVAMTESASTAEAAPAEAGTTAAPPAQATPTGTESPAFRPAAHRQRPERGRKKKKRRR